MKKYLIFTLTILSFIIVACGAQPVQTTPEPAAPTQAAAQPTLAPTPANIATDTAAPAAGTSNGSVSFAKDVMPIFENSCNECHGDEQIKKGLDLRTYESLMAGSSNGPVLTAGNSADSFLVQQVTEGKMPKRGPKLTPEQIKTISDWIDAGALNN